MTYAGASRTRSSRGTLFTRRALKDRCEGNSVRVWVKFSQQPSLPPLFFWKSIPRVSIG